MWFQLGPVDKEVLIYGYTGWQWGIANATFDVANCPELNRLQARYNRFASRSGCLESNHGILTKYLDGTDNIGPHSDKPQNIADASLITIVKLGPSARPFRFETLDGKLIFEKMMSPGTAIIMTKESNLLCKHAVPVVEEKKTGLSGSVVFRTITRKEAVGKIRKKTYETNRKRHAKESDRRGKKQHYVE